MPGFRRYASIPVLSRQESPKVFRPPVFFLLFSLTLISAEITLSFPNTVSINQSFSLVWTHTIRLGDARVFQVDNKDTTITTTAPFRFLITTTAPSQPATTASVVTESAFLTPNIVTSPSSSVTLEFQTGSSSPSPGASTLHNLPPSTASSSSSSLHSGTSKIVIPIAVVSTLLVLLCGICLVRRRNIQKRRELYQMAEPFPLRPLPPPLQPSYEDHYISPSYPDHYASDLSISRPNSTALMPFEMSVSETGSSRGRSDIGSRRTGY
ncbi:hypothetical protein C8J56DRAFT_1113933 [Mycena floridula]|nr:hypothetical protein C8J56DRAFT_1113933 [Mycena floridula]